MPRRRPRKVDCADSYASSDVVVVVSSLFDHVACVYGYAASDMAVVVSSLFEHVDGVERVVGGVPLDEGMTHGSSILA
jgi:hypothetical protein